MLLDLKSESLDHPLQAEFQPVQFWTVLLISLADIRFIQIWILG